MSVADKLQIRPGTAVAVLAAPEAVDLGLSGSEVTDPDAAAAVIAFVSRAADLETVAAPALRAARDDRLSWIAYPKGGQLGTDLNRDRLAALVIERGARPVRQIAIDETWSALRFRPGPAEGAGEPV